MSQTLLILFNKIIRSILNVWSFRSLFLLGKITIIKSLVVPILIYKVSLVPCQIPNDISVHLRVKIGTSSSVRRILKRGGGGGARNFRKILEEQRSETEIVTSKISPIFGPKLGEKQQKKRFSLKFDPIFRPKLGEEQKKGLHSNFVRFFAQTWVQACKKCTEHTLCVIKPYAQLTKGGPCLNFAYFSMQFYNPGDPKGETMAQCPPLNTPLGNE